MHSLLVIFRCFDFFLFILLFINVLSAIKFLGKNTGNIFLFIIVLICVNNNNSVYSGSNNL